MYRNTNLKLNTILATYFMENSKRYIPRCSGKNENSATISG